MLSAKPLIPHPASTLGTLGHHEYYRQSTAHYAKLKFFLDLSCCIECGISAKHDAYFEGTACLQLLIKGIRSFSPDNQVAIEFYKPLTLIVGQNGAGKTVRLQQCHMCANKV